MAYLSSLRSALPHPEVTVLVCHYVAGHQPANCGGVVLGCKNVLNSSSAIDSILGGSAFGSNTLGLWRGEILLYNN